MYMRLKNKRIVYALYRGDEFLDCGTAEELAERRGISKLSFSMATTPKRIKRSEKVPYENRLITIKFFEKTTS